jgi:hypothetical protein
MMPVCTLAREVSAPPSRRLSPDVVASVILTLRECAHVTILLPAGKQRSLVRVKMPFFSC